MSGPRPMMTDAEIELLARHLQTSDLVWEWGSGDSTRWLASRVRQVISVEHQPRYAASLVALAPPNVSVLFHPPGGPYQEGGDDGDYDTFRSYVESYTGRGVNVVLIDGRARCAAARWVAHCAQFGPTPKMKIFLHDCDRSEYSDIWTIYFKEVERVERLMLLKMRDD